MLDEKAMSFMKRMMESLGPSGFERETSRIVKEYIQEYADEIHVDKLGSLIAIARGREERPHVLVAGHVDEVGFVISGIDEQTGFLTFNSLGSWWDQVLLSQRVIVRTQKGDLPGVIAAKPPHLLSREEREKVVARKDMYIDIGATSKSEAEEMGVRIGDPAIPWSPFSVIRQGKIVMGKSFDDRLGAFVAIGALRRIKEQKIVHPNTLYAVATVQEEVGLRGARTVSHLVDPDVGLAIEVDIAGDVPGIKAFEAPTKLGKGPSLLTYDSSMIPNQLLKEFVIETAKEANVPLQTSIVSGGGTDAGQIHLSRAGCPSVVISVPTRHIHSQVSLASVEDTEKAIELVVKLVEKLDREKVEKFTAL